MRQRGCDPLVLLTTTDLLALPGWTHQLRDGRASVELVLADGRVLDDGCIAGVLNRLTWVPPALLATWHADDRDYAAQEFVALLLSSLHSLSAPVLNRPDPSGLCGRWRFAADWAVLAARAGLPIRPVRIGTEPARVDVDGPPMPADECREIVVVDGTVIGAADTAQVHAACRRLAGAAGTAVLGIRMVHDRARGWCFTTATPLPDLLAAGPAALDALAGALGADVAVPT